MVLGKMGSAQEIATKLAEQCFEALIAGDYRTLAQLNDVRSATWKGTSVVKRHGHDAETSADMGMFLAPSHERTERTIHGMKEIQIWDGQKDKAIRLLPAAKMALVLELKSPPRETYGTAFLTMRKAIADAQRGTGGYVERLGVQTIDDSRAEGFRVRRGSAEVTFWTDPKTSLPVRVETVALVGDDEVRSVTTDFQINLDLDESLLASTCQPVTRSKRCRSTSPMVQSLISSKC